MTRKAVVIGAGLGGMSAAVRLAVAGFSVDVFEQNEIPGGKAGSLNDSGFRFDTGPSLLTMPFVIKDLFDSAGENINDYLQINRLAVLCKYFWDDGTVINSFSDTQKFAAEVASKTSDSVSAVINYLGYCKSIYELTADIFLFGNPKEIKNYLSISALKTLFKLHKIDPFRTMHKANSFFFKDKKTIQLFDRYATYNGSDPFRTPATFNLIQHVEYNLGGYVIKGGIYSLTEAIFKLAKKTGVQFYFGSKVDSIISNGKQITGIKVKDKIKNYEIILSNADVITTYRNLLKDKLNVNTDNLSSSALVFYWGVKGNYDSLDTHNILFSSDYKKEFEDIFFRKISPDDPTVYIYISSKFNPEDAPEGHENWFVMINTPAMNNRNREIEIEESRKNILLKIKNILGIDLNNKIITENILNAESLEYKTGSYKGSIYGLSSNSPLSAFLRYPNRSKKYKGLYFCGGTVHPGGGIPLVLLSGKNAADIIFKDYDKSRT